MSFTDLRTLPELKLPKAVEADPRHAQLVALFAESRAPIWEKGHLTFGRAHFTPALEMTLRQALNFRHLDLGLERIDQALDNEKKGLDALREKQGTPPANRVSRLLIVANDGSERFYRACEQTALKHADRLLLLVTDVPAEVLAAKLFGQGREIKALLVSERDSVSRVLLSLLQTLRITPP